MPFDPLAPLPLLTADLPGIGGRIKASPEDFEVEEIPAYLPTGEGAHLFLWVQKTGMGAEFFQRRLARILGVPAEDIGTAGLKDRHAVTRQWVSVPASAEPRVKDLDGEGVLVLSVSRHPNKLRPGHLHGNRFRVLVREPTAPDALPPLLERLRSHGLPNFYGPQRFGRDGETLQVGLDLMRGDAGRVSGFLRRLALSAVQSAVFNHVLANRLADGLLRRVVAGDVMKKWPFGGMFNAADLSAEQARLDARETVPTGPMFGKKMFPALDEAAKREETVLAEAGLEREAFSGFGKMLSGTRRYLLVHPGDLSATIEPEGVRLSFSLPAGSYATVLAGELTHSGALAAEDADD
ncbi:MAG: tRNA pseudouridine(13) synthase TruD [Gemmataceae bacterium]|nr:tRNA pseudouridine(13) synthase TruD [Gemmataceae bacterium]